MSYNNSFLSLSITVEHRANLSNGVSGMLWRGLKHFANVFCCDAFHSFKHIDFIMPLTVVPSPQSPMHDVGILGWLCAFEQGKGSFSRIGQLFHGLEAVAVPHHHKAIVLHRRNLANTEQASVMSSTAWSSTSANSFMANSVLAA